MRMPVKVLALCIVAGVAACGRSEVTGPAGREEPAPAPQRAGGAGTSPGFPADTLPPSGVSEEGAYGIGSGG